MFQDLKQPKARRHRAKLTDKKLEPENQNSRRNDDFHFQSINQSVNEELLTFDQLID